MLPSDVGVSLFRKSGVFVRIKTERLSRTVQYLLCLTATKTASVPKETKVSVMALLSFSKDENEKSNVNTNLLYHTVCSSLVFGHH